MRIDGLSTHHSLQLVPCEHDESGILNSTNCKEWSVFWGVEKLMDRCIFQYEEAAREWGFRSAEWHTTNWFFQVSKPYSHVTTCTHTPNWLHCLLGQQLSLSSCYRRRSYPCAPRLGRNSTWHGYAHAIHYTISGNNPPRSRHALLWIVTNASRLISNRRQQHIWFYTIVTFDRWLFGLPRSFHTWFSIFWSPNGVCMATKNCVWSTTRQIVLNITLIYLHTQHRLLWTGSLPYWYRNPMDTRLWCQNCESWSCVLQYVFLSSMNSRNTFAFKVWNWRFMITSIFQPPHICMHIQWNVVCGFYTLRLNLIVSR